jgi:hypothetical protein
MKSVPGVACKVSNTSVANEQISRNGNVAESCRDRETKLHISLETQPEHAPKLKSTSEVYIAYPRIVNNRVFLQKSHFVLSVCLQFFPGHIFFWIKQLNSLV